MDNLLKKNEPARFSQEDIASFTQSDLLILRTYTPISKGNSDRVHKLVAEKGIKNRVNSAEQELIAKALQAKQEGTGFTGVSIEDRAYPAGTNVIWGSKIIKLETASGTQEEIPNIPLISVRPLTKMGSGRLALWVCSLYDIDKGVLRAIRDPTIDNDVFKDSTCVYNPAGVQPFMVVVEDSLVKNGMMAKVLEAKTTMKSHAMTDFVHAWINKLNMDDYLAINHLLQYNLWRNIKIDEKGTVFTKNVTTIVNNVPVVEKLVPSNSWRLYPQNLLKQTPANSFISNGLAPMVMDQPFAPRQKWSKSYESALALCADYKRSMTLRGGNKRGIGKICTYLDYCPRQGDAIRRANFFIWALSQKSQDAAVDVHLNPGDVALMVTWLHERRLLNTWQNVNIVMAEKDMKGVKAETFIQNEKRSDAIQIKIMEWITVPDCTNTIKTREAGLSNISSMHTKYANSIAGKYIVLAPRFSDLQVDNSWPIGKGHDLMAVHSNCLDTISGLRDADEKPMSWRDWMERCRVAFRDVNGWMLCGGPIFNKLGTYYTPPRRPLSVIDGNWVIPVYDTEEVLDVIQSDWVSSDASQFKSPVTTVTTTTTTNNTTTTKVTTTTVVDEYVRAEQTGVYDGGDPNDQGKEEGSEEEETELY